MQMKNRTILLQLLKTIVFFYLFASVSYSGEPPSLYVIPISGKVDIGMAAFVKRAVAIYNKDKNSIFIFKIDTFGGRVDSALKIVDYILSIPKIKTIAFVDKKAISAGALITLACGRLVMKNNTTIGDCAPIMFLKEGPKMMGEKFQSPLRAKFRTLAKRNGYPAKLAEAMVTAGKAVYCVKWADKIKYMDELEIKELETEEAKTILSKKTIVAEGELLTMGDNEAYDLGFSQMSVADFDEMVEKLDLTKYKKVFVNVSWSESLVGYISVITPFLLMIGIGALYTEIKAPGFGVFGIVGISCLFLVLFNQYFAGLADHTEILIILIGIGFLLLEVVVFPGFGISGITGICFICAGLILSLQDFVIPDPQIPWQKSIFLTNIAMVLVSFVSAFFISLFFVAYILPKFSKIIKGPCLDTNLKGSHANLPMTDKINIKDTGIAFTLLRPSGKVLINDEILDVITTFGQFIEKGAAVTVIEIRGGIIVVDRLL